MKPWAEARDCRLLGAQRGTEGPGARALKRQPAGRESFCCAWKIKGESALAPVAPRGNAPFGGRRCARRRPAWPPKPFDLSLTLPCCVPRPRPPPPFTLALCSEDIQSSPLQERRHLPKVTQ